MKSKQMHTLVGAAVLIVAIVGVVYSKGMVKDDASENTLTTQNPTRPGSSTTKVPSSVNPNVVQEKPVPVTPTAKSLAGSSFRLTTYNGQALPPDSKYTLSFTETSFSLKLCNSLGSTYYITDNMLKASNVMSTLMYCGSPSNIMKIESDASLMLSSGQTTIYMSGSTLILSHASGIVMAFEGF